MCWVVNKGLWTRFGNEDLLRRASGIFEMSREIKERNVYDLDFLSSGKTQRLMEALLCDVLLSKEGVMTRNSAAHVQVRAKHGLRFNILT